MGYLSTSSGAKGRYPKFREWDETGSDVLEPLDPDSLDSARPKDLEQWAAEHPGWGGYRRALSATKAQGLE